MVKTFFLIFCVLSINTMPCFSQVDSAEVKRGHEKVQKSFDGIVDKFVDFFQVKQKLVYKEAHKKSKSGYAAYLIEITCKEINYGVNSATDADVLHKAYIILDLTKRDNRACGKLSGATMFGRPSGWESITDALANNKPACFKQKSKSYHSKIRINFVYKNDKWTFTDVKNEIKKKPQPEFSSVFGKPLLEQMAITESAGLKFNQKWLTLVR